ncbi:MAG: class I SAM-dependent methyltransferase, partial [Abditibacteriales bacterium]|nr:class I SAM-dependent methyltransferase [Abditibacteriales bacterium]
MKVVLPAESDYPAEAFRPDLPPEWRVGCARAYFKTNAVARGIFRRRLEVALTLMPPHCGRVLDAGTGVGFLLPALAERAEEVEGVDLAPVLRFAQAMLDRRGVRNVHLTHADLLHLPFRPGAFEVIVCLSVIEHIPDPTAAFAEMERVLRDDGALIVGYPLEHAVYHFFKSLCRA